MFHSRQQYPTGTTYTTTVALLAMAFIFSPAVLALYRPFGYLSVSLAVMGSACCIAFAWFDWKRNSTLTIPSVVPHSGKPGR